MLMVKEDKDYHTYDKDKRVEVEEKALNKLKAFTAIDKVNNEIYADYKAHLKRNYTSNKNGVYPNCLKPERC